MNSNTASFLLLIIALTAVRPAAGQGAEFSTGENLSFPGGPAVLEPSSTRSRVLTALHYASARRGSEGFSRLLELMKAHPGLYCETSDGQPVVHNVYQMVSEAIAETISDPTLLAAYRDRARLALAEASPFDLLQRSRIALHYRYAAEGQQALTSVIARLVDMGQFDIASLFFEGWLADRDETSLCASKAERPIVRLGVVALLASREDKERGRELALACKNNLPAGSTDLWQTRIQAAETMQFQLGFQQRLLEIWQMRPRLPSSENGPIQPESTFTRRQELRQLLMEAFLYGNRQALFNEMFRKLSYHTGMDVCAHWDPVVYVIRSLGVGKRVSEQVYQMYPWLEDAPPVLVERLRNGGSSKHLAVRVNKLAKEGRLTGPSRRLLISALVDGAPMLNGISKGTAREYGYALRALGPDGYEQVRPLLDGNDGNQRIVAIIALGGMGERIDDETVEDIFRLGLEARFNSECVSSLSEMGQRAHRELLKHLSPKANLSKPRSLALEVLDKNPTNCGLVVPQLRGLLKTQEEAHESILSILVRCGAPASAAAEDILELAISTEYKTIRQSAFAALFELGPHAMSAKQGLVDALDHESATIRSASAHVLSNMGPNARDAVTKLLPLLEDPDEGVQASSLEALVKLGYPEERSDDIGRSLWKIAKSWEAERDQVDLAARALANEPAFIDLLEEPLREAFESQYWRPQQLALFVVSGWGPAAKRFLPETLAALEHQSPETRKYALEAIESIGETDPKAIEALLDCALLVRVPASSSNPLDWKRAVNILIRFGKSEETLMHVRAYKEKNDLPEQQLRAANILAYLASAGLPEPERKLGAP